MLYKTFLAELKKSQHTFVPWLTLSGSLLVPLVCFLIYCFKWKYFIPETGVNSWDEYTQMSLSFASGMLFPFLVIIMVALNINLENKANSWKRLYVMPVGRDTLFWGKLLFLSMQLLICSVFMFFWILLTGLFLGIMHPELLFLEYSPDIFNLLMLSLRFFISLLGVLSIQYFLSLLLNNIIVPITAGVMLVIVSLMLVQGWEYSVYDPYAFPLLFSWNNSGKMVQIAWWGLLKTEWLSMLYYIVFSIMAMVLFKRKPVR